MRDIPALLALFGARLRTPFAWGPHDCASFAFDAVQAQTGEDRFLYRGKYAAAAGAVRILKRIGGLEGLLDAQFERIAPAHAHRGDLALVNMAEGPTIMVVDGPYLVAPGPTGLVRTPRTELDDTGAPAFVLAWRTA